MSRDTVFSESEYIPSRITLTAYYGVGIFAVTIGITVVILLNLFTPLHIIQQNFIGPGQSVTWATFSKFFLPRLVVILIVVYGIVILGLRLLLRPIAVCLALYRAGMIPDDKQLCNAQKRLLNLQYLFARMNVLLWIIMPALVFAGSVAVGMLDHRTAMIFAARASMVGLIASSIVTLRIELVSRKTLIPYFFPTGVSSQMEGVKPKSIRHRIVLVNRLVSLIPVIILLVTLLTLQWELENVSISAFDYSRELIIFTFILACWTFAFTKLLSQLQSRNIVEPIIALVTRLRGVEKGEYDEKIQVTSNDEIGYAGEVVNTMTQGLKERLTMQRSLDLARQVQQNLLPKNDPVFPGLDIAGLSIYCDATGGDYYDYIEFDDKGREKVGIIIGDVSGHGISSALLMATARGFLRQRAAMSGAIVEIISDVNHQLTRDVASSGNFMTMFFLAIDKHSKRLEWVRAGHDPAILYDTDTNSISELKGAGIALGVDQDFCFEENEKLHLLSGQILLLGTDGIWEARNSTGKMFGKDPVHRILRENSHCSANEILDEITKSLADFQGNVAAEDDFTCIIVKASP